MTMPPTITEAEFAALLARSGLVLPAEQRAAIFAAWGHVEAMREAVRAPAPGIAPLSAAAAAAEPAVTFRAEPGA
jgi:hypothetical protein